jgi:hypothetical protein
MRDTDVRSKCIALVPEALVNAHLAADGPAKRVAAAGLDLVERLGFGIVALPEHDVSPARARVALELAVDQVRDYAANGYRVVAVGLAALPQSGLWHDTLIAELNRRGIVLSAAVEFDPRDDAAALASTERRLSAAVGDVRRLAS